jgi:hypothetical protein
MEKEEKVHDKKDKIEIGHRVNSAGFKKNRETNTEACSRL